jgi:hypothetical protein
VSILDLLIPGDDKPHDRWRWATITDASPLRLRFDGDTTEIDVTDTLVDPLSLVVSDRVWCQVFGRRIIVLGKGGGFPAPPSPFADTGWLAIPYNAGYQNFSALYLGQYRVITVNGVVETRLRGLVERIAGPFAAGTAYTPVFTLPVGARPSQPSFFPLGTSTSTTGGMLLVNTSGICEIRTHTVALTWASLDGITFLND